jgi:dTDP-4-amino-4,6-dideoxygalactose transaminase
MISIVQWPTVRQLIELPSGAQHDKLFLGAAWLGRGERVHWMSRGAWALAAIGRGSAVTTGRAPRVWIPDYFCNAALGALRAVGVSPVFYRITPSGTPDWEACRKAAAHEPPDIFILVHYFGAPNDGTGARAFANAYDALLIEDAAHVLQPTPAIGEHGDFVFYSPHKWLALPDGAVLVANPTARAQACPIDRALESFGTASAPAAPWIVKRLIQMSPLGPIAVRLRRKHLGFEQDPEPRESQSLPMMSNTALRLLGRQDLAAIAIRRRENYDALKEVLRPLGGVPAWTCAAVPYRLALRLPTPADAAEIYARIQRAGLPVETWPDMPHEVAAEYDKHAAAYALRRTIVLLPIHQSLTSSQLTHAYGQVFFR